MTVRRQLAVAAVAGLAAFGAAFAAAGGSGSEDRPRAAAQAPRHVTLPDVEVATVPVTAVRTGGSLPRFKSPQPKRRDESDAGGSTLPATGTDTTPGAATGGGGTGTGTTTPPATGGGGTVPGGTGTTPPTTPDTGGDQGGDDGGGDQGGGVVGGGG